MHHYMAQLYLQTTKHPRSRVWSQKIHVIVRMCGHNSILLNSSAKYDPPKNGILGRVVFWWESALSATQSLLRLPPCT